MVTVAFLWSYGSFSFIRIWPEKPIFLRGVLCAPLKFLSNLAKGLKQKVYLVANFYFWRNCRRKLSGWLFLRPAPLPCALDRVKKTLKMLLLHKNTILMKEAAVMQFVLAVHKNFCYFVLAYHYFGNFILFH